MKVFFVKFFTRMKARFFIEIIPKKNIFKTMFFFINGMQI